MLARTALSVIVGLAAVAAWPQENTSTGEIWGGTGVLMTVTTTGGTLEFDCAHGVLDQPIRPDAKGQFQVPGTYTPERGGPVSKANPPSALNAVYKGSIRDDTMHLEVILGDNEKLQAPQSVTLTRGKAGHLVRCR